MQTLLYIIAKTIDILLNVVSTAMFVRVILSFFVNPEESRVYAFCCFITEPFIIPFRVILAKLGVGEGIPIDLPFMVAYFTLSFVMMFLPII